MSEVGVAASVDDVRAHLAAARGYRLVRTSPGELLYRLYLVFGIGGVYLLAGVSGVVEPDVSAVPSAVPAAVARGLLVGGAAMLTVAVVRLSTWAGPVMVGRQDAAWLLPAPLDRRALLRPYLVGGLLVGGAAGGALGVTGSILLAASTSGHRLRTIVVGTLAAVLVGVASAAGGWFVEADARVARLVHRSGPLGWAAAAGLGWLAASRPGSVWWSPWGWAVAGAVDASADPVRGWPVGAVLAVGVAVVLVRAADRGLPAAPDEELRRRAGLGGDVASAVTYVNARSISDAHEDGVRRFRPVRRFRLRRPSSPWLLPAWLDLVTLRRRGHAVARSSGVVLAAGALLVALDGRFLGWVVVGALVDAAVAPLLHQARSTLAQPALARPYPFGVRPLVLLHLAVPAAVLVAEVAAAATVLVLLGQLSPGAVLTATVIAALAAPVLVLLGAVVGSRGDPPLHLMIMGGWGSTMIFAWFALGPLLGVLLLGLPVGALATDAALTARLTSPLALALQLLRMLAPVQLVLLGAALMRRTGR